MRRQLLLVDDDALDRRTIRRVLDRSNWTIVEAATLADARRCLIDTGFDCALVDMGLPDGVGVSLLPELSRRDIPAVILTGVDDESVGYDALHEGAQDYLMKAEVSPRILNRVLRYAIERQAIQQERREHTRRLRQFVQVLYHDFAQPIRQLMQLSQLLEGGELPAEGQEIVGLMRASSTKMLSLLSSLKDYLVSGNETIHPQTIALDEVLAHALETLDDAERVQVSPLPTINGDPNLLMLMFQNLLTNGLKYSDGPVWVQLLEETADEWVLTVTDTGHGIPESELERIFEPFQRLSQPRAVKGTGLGLSIVRHIVSSHGGRIYAANRPDGGAVLTIRLPKSIDTV
ncbi:MAG: hybrid sensor histidine kinase/response regulator [Myxococcota bacterium]